MFLKFLFKSICLGFLVGLIVYVSSKLIGTGVNSTVIGTATAVVVAAINIPKLLSANQKSAKPL